MDLDLIRDNKDIRYEDNFFKDTSLLEFRKRIDFVQNINTSIELELLVRKYYDYLLKQYDNTTNLFFKYSEIMDELKNKNYDFLYNYDDFDYFIDKKLIIKLQDYWHYSDKLELIYKELRNRTNLKISEIVVDGLFEDTIYNVWINIREMLRYNECLSSDEKLLDEDKISFYQTILNIDNLNCDEKIRIYNNLKNKNVALMFYEDLRRVKDKSYSEIKNNLFKVIEYEKLLNREKSLEYGVPIYDLETEKFYILISCRDKYNEVDCVRRHCYSLITDTNMKVYRKDRFIYGYTNFDIGNILHVFERDSYSSNGNGISRNSFTTNRVNRIMTLKQIRNTIKYNEIQIINKEIDDNKFEVMKPDYLVVFEKLEIRHLEEAKRLSIPIVRINTKNYLYQKNQELSNLEYVKVRDDYTEGVYQEDDRISRRLYRG